MGYFFANYTATADKCVIAIPKPGSGFTINGYSTTSINTDVKGLLCNAGAQRDIYSDLRAGVILRLPFFKTEGKGRYAAFGQDTNGVVANIGIKKVSAEYDIPLDVSVGLSYLATEKLDLIGDLSYQFATDYSPLEGTGNKVSSQGTLRWNTGLRYKMRPNFSLMGGAAYNSNTKNLKTSSDVKENVWVGTAGLEMTEKIATIGVGLFYAKSNGESHAVSGTVIGKHVLFSSLKDI